MTITERLASSWYYVVDGVIRKPKIWVILSIFGLGNFILTTGQNSIIYRYCTKLIEGTHISLPPPLYQYSLLIVILMIVIGILFLILQSGYITRIYRGISPAPPVSNLKFLFLDGLKFVIINLIYSIIPTLILIWTVIIPLIQEISSLHQKPSTEKFLVVLSPDLLHTIAIAIGGILLSGLLFFIMAIISIIGLIRFSRSGRMRSAFELSAIITKISEIGWIRYILSLLLLFIIILVWGIGMEIITLIFSLFGYISASALPGAIEIMIGIRILALAFLESLIMVFAARYLTVLFNTGKIHLENEGNNSDSGEQLN